ncbi:Dehydrogenase (flavoprotein) [Pedobacter westerhofensis]|uniref:Dehydrogenase (Flavoprotein) n=1 Tax=Pedobacter westerhofensis TaxID=425512 RepID=A0A521AND9_9SPHI|nr:NAD(P)/FAD-dependent oxidoreductase [Pedobacter westerhofensis]SMO36327.1 Dehydrogenase (flavoprotein) [Pedobacter westerhofensis]
MMHTETEVLIIGGGLAGLTAALHLHRAGIGVMIVEKASYPHHKVCGEYISNEVLPYLQWLDADPRVLGATEITTLQFSVLSGKSIHTTLPMGGFGISRFILDNFLYEQFKSRGGTVARDTVSEVRFENDQFKISTLSGKNISARQVIGAYGKRSAMDLKLKRTFIQEKSPYLAVKAHYSGTFPSHLVGLHNFRGGYCGVSKVEEQKINICYLADYRSFKAYKNINSYQQQVLGENKHLRNIFEQAEPLFEPLTVSQLAFGAKEAVNDHILMIGDTAGLIHPLCGNGMAMAINSAKICAELLTAFLGNKIAGRSVLEKLYISSWDKQFRSRLRMGSILSYILGKESLADMILKGMISIPPLLPLIIRKTHGEILTVDQ